MGVGVRVEWFCGIRGIYGEGEKGIYCGRYGLLISIVLYYVYL